MNGKSHQATPLLVKLIEVIFVRIPLAFARLVLNSVSKINKTWIKWLILGSMISVPVFLILGEIKFGLSTRFFHEHLAKRFALDPSLRVLFLYLLYNLILFPLFLLMASFSKIENEKAFGHVHKTKQPWTLRMRGHRAKSCYEKVYLGESFSRAKPIYLTNDQRLMHTQVIGSTGTGKTESVLLPILAHDIARGKGAIVIDGKGDLELLRRIHYIIHKKRKPEDFYFFSISNPEKSHSYNPLKRGNATELKDKIIGSIPWGEEFYRRKAEEAMLALLSAFKSVEKMKEETLKTEEEKKKIPAIRFQDLHSCLTDSKVLSDLKDSLSDKILKNDLSKMINQFKDHSKFLSGLIADLYLMSRSGFSGKVNVSYPEIDLREIYENQKVVYFQLDLQGYGDTAKRIGRMILQDIRAVSSYIQSHIPEGKRHFFPVFIDDASSFLDLNFIDFLNKARASCLAISLFHQSLGDLVYRRDFALQQQVIENTNIKIILRQDDPGSVEKLSKVGGTRRTLISTYQTEEKLIGKGLTGVGSIREGQTFRIDPDLVRALKRGEAVVIWKTPSFHTDYLKLDFFGYPPFVEKFKPWREKDEIEENNEQIPLLVNETPKKEEKEIEVNEKEEDSKRSSNDLEIQDDISSNINAIEKSKRGF